MLIFIKICKTANKHSDCFYKNTTNIVLKGVLKYATIIVERIKNNIMNTMLYEHHKNIGKIINNSLYFTVLLAFFSSQNMMPQTPLYAHATEIPKLSYANSTILPQTTPVPDVQTFSLTEEKQRWEAMLRQRYKNGSIKTVAEGVKHIRMLKYINSRPIKINIIEINTKVNPNLEIAPQLASKNLKRRATIRTIAQKNNSIAAINGTYFKPQTGVPLGTLMIDRKLYTGPMHNRVAMGIGENGYKMAKVQFDSQIKSRNNTLRIDNINQPRMLSTYVLMYTRDWGLDAPPPPKYGANLAISKDGKIVSLNYGSTTIPNQGYVISGPKAKLEPFFNAKKIELDIKTNPNWEDVNHIISGGPYLVKDGEVFVDVTAQKLGSITGKNPRTAIGYTENGEFIMITIDGREHASVGMTLTQLAYLMKSFGCINAMNLDGGGSTVMYVQGQVVNSPAQKGGIPISNALTVYDKTSVATR